MTDSTKLAIDAINRIHDLWMVDKDCVQWVGDASASTLQHQGFGFNWWPGDFKVELRVTGPHPELGPEPNYRLTVRTDFLRDADVTRPNFGQYLSHLNKLTPAFAICAHPATDAENLAKYEPLREFRLDLKSSKVWLASTANLHEGVEQWLPHAFGVLAILQPVEAQFRAATMAPLLGGKPDHSRPPTGETPAAMDNLIGVEQAMLEPHGQQACRWVGTGEFEAIIAKWGQSDHGFGLADYMGLTMETPFGNETAMISLRTDRPHPRLGNGLTVILSLPHTADESTHALTNRLNYLEDRLLSKFSTPLIGSWHAVELTGSGFSPEFNFFVPNVLYFPDLAENLVLYAMARAKWAREILRPGAVDLPMYEILEKRFGPIPRKDTRTGVAAGLFSAAKRLLRGRH
ncbi:MAG: hypothetical protein JWQ17_662 [Tardiphaga sp.]|jgi:hypothetical protein|nr:hypothetical protein [Tardiphaga sp.]